MLDDALLRFWFRFVFPHRSQLAQLEQKVLHDPNPKNHPLRRHAFVPTLRGRPPEGVELHRLADLG